MQVVTIDATTMGTFFFVLIVCLASLKKIKLVEFLIKVYVVVLIIWGFGLIYTPLRDNVVYPWLDAFIRGSLGIIVEILKLLSEYGV